MSGERNAPSDRRNNRNDYVDDDTYRSRLTVRKRSRLQQALNTATIDTQLAEIIRADEEKDQQILLNASYVREATIRDRMNNLYPRGQPRSEYADRFNNIMSITGTRTQRDTQNDQLRAFADSECRY